MILVTGDTGFISSHACVELLQAVHDVLIIDNLCNSQAAVVKRITEITARRPIFAEGDVACSYAAPCGTQRELNWQADRGIDALRW